MFKDNRSRVTWRAQHALSIGSRQIVKTWPFGASAFKTASFPPVTYALINAIHIVGVTGGREFLPRQVARDVTIAAAIRLAIWEASFRDVEIKRIAIMARQPRIRHC